MNVFKCLFLRKNKKSASKDRGLSFKPKSKAKKVPAIADSNNINSNILSGIYVEDVSVLRIDDKPLANLEELPLCANASEVQSGDSNCATHEIADVDSITSTVADDSVSADQTVSVSETVSADETVTTDETASVSETVSVSADETVGVSETVGTNVTVSINGTVDGTDITITSSDGITTEATDDDSLDADIQTLPAVTRDMCNIDSVAGIEEVLNQIIKELNKIIIERERLRRKLKLKGNSYKIVARKFNTLLNNRAYKPIKMA
ncbi:hypothetical protein TOT_010000606 [Theileria orientalis strain Shintoku]|uniref:Uncharacterized protein n=1 Tax=Theileria orientalis strain Shintoku TaxID=869250 RepID=J4D5S2_THEOR|nr:hypothetical protein TOT_010000606 [Theileria orientalis strain Shintoku]BAM39145.1 hypothetical protein TOT_010000606 [Theileria orientalis strain Shintoku]|eukprot:XP_009689446.1 hypothetical protein TOT_010000606 [Theileria orientalis strain Shintoku]